MSFHLTDVVRNYPTAFVIYAIFALHSFLFQAFIRLEQCIGVAGCSESLAKDAAWSIIWPIYWLGRFVFF